MMKKLLILIDEAIAQEKALADKDYGRMHGRHEGFGVLAEEFCELDDEMKEISWRAENLIHYVDNKRWTDVVKIIEEHARLCAAEAVQVAAVCGRILDIESEVCDTCKIDLEEE